MWVFTTEGFFSAVAHRTEPNTIIVRCRDEGDANHLSITLKLMLRLDAPVRHTPTADYAYRLFMPRSAWSHYLASRAKDIDYPNFKDAVAARQGTKRALIYSDVWLAMLRLQHPERNPIP